MNFTLYDVADRLRTRGWFVPAYPMPANRSDLVVQRVVVKHGFTHDMADMPIADLEAALTYFEKQPGHQRSEAGSHFHH